MGAVSTVLDLSVGGLLLWLGAPTRVAAMAGTLVGAGLSYFLNRAVAFRDDGPKRRSLPRFAVVTIVASAIHGQFVVWFRGLGLPYIAAKMAADVIVYSVGQLLLLRYVVFPRKLSVQPAAAPDAPGNGP